MVLNCLAPDPGVILGKKNVALVCESKIKEMIRGMDSGLLGLDMRVKLVKKVFIVSKN